MTNSMLDQDEYDMLIDLDSTEDLDLTMKKCGKVSMKNENEFARDVLILPELLFFDRLQQSLQRTFCNPLPNTVILLDSDDDDNNGNDSDGLAQKDPLDSSSYENVSFVTRSISPVSHTVYSNDTIRPATLAPSPVHILSSPSPPPVQHCQSPSYKETERNSPLSPTHADVDMSFAPSSVDFGFDEETQTGTDAIPSSPPFLGAYTSNDDLLVVSPPSKRTFDMFSADTDADACIISDNDSVDSLPSAADFLSQIGSQMIGGKRKRVGNSGITNTIDHKGKQVDTTYRSTSTTTTTTSLSSVYDDSLLTSDKLWEWESMMDSSSLRDTSNDLAHDTPPVLTKAARSMQRKAEQEAKKQQKERDKADALRRKEQDKADALRRKEQDKAEALRRKEQDKAEALRLKEQGKQLQQVNRLRKDRDELVKEITVVILDTTFYQSEHGTLLRTVLEEKGGKVISRPPTTTSTTTYTLTWQMECRAQWDDNEKHFIPFANGESRFKDESSVLTFLTAEGFVGIIHRNKVEAWIDSIQHTAPNKQVFLMIEGLDTFYKKKTALLRRQFASTVLGNMGDRDSSDASDTSNRRPKKRSKSKDTTVDLIENGPSQDQIADALAYLQVIKDVMLIQTSNEKDSVDWLVCLTTDLAKATYNTINTAGLFKGQGGSTKSGVDAADVWSKMLQEIQNCTPAVAKSVIQQYPNAMALYQRYTQVESNARDHLLANIEVERSVLSSRDRTINKFMSSKIHKIFMTDDPTDIVI